MLDRFWDSIEKIVKYIIAFFSHNLDDAQEKVIIQLVKFGIVGLTNNIIYYLIYVLFVYLGIDYIVSNIFAFLISVFNAYYWNNRYVFQDGNRRIWWLTFLKTFISYSGTGIILSNVLLYIFVEILGISTICAPLIELAITIPVNFVINKVWTYK